MYEPIEVNKKLVLIVKNKLLNSKIVFIFQNKENIYQSLQYLGKTK